MDTRTWTSGHHHRSLNPRIADGSTAHGAFKRSTTCRVIPERKHNARMVYNPSYPDNNMADFRTRDWTEFYRSVKEPIPPNAPPSRGKPVDLRMYVDSEIAGDRVRRRLTTGFFVLLNSALIQWVSKRQPTIETSVFGAEFIAMKHRVDTLQGIR